MFAISKILRTIFLRADDVGRRAGDRMAISNNNQNRRFTVARLRRSCLYQRLAILLAMLLEEPSMKNTLHHLLRTASVLAVLACTSAAAYGSIIFEISPDSGAVQLNKTFTLDVSLTGLDPNNPLYDYTFDLNFDPAVFQLVSDSSGTIFDCMPGCFFDPTIDNVAGKAAGVSGIDVNMTFNGTGGLLGEFVFQPIAMSPGSDITLANTGLQTFAAASNLGGFDLASDPSPTATLTVVSTPEPFTGLLAAIGIGLIALGRKRFL
jgi:hypothetical protein